MNAVLGTVVAGLAGLWLSAGVATAAVVYESSGGTSALAIADSGFTQVGDYVIPDGGATTLVNAVVPFSTPTRDLAHPDVTPAYTPAFLRLTLYRNRFGAPGDEIASSKVAGPLFPLGGNSQTGGIDVVFPFANVEVPGVFFFGVSHLDANSQPVSSEDSNGLAVYVSFGSDPDVGSSSETIIYESGGQWSEWELPPPPANVDITFNSPLPEPGTGVPFLLAAAALACRRTRRGGT